MQPRTETKLLPITFSKKISDIFTLVVVLILSSLAVWDTTEIINDYVDDNRLTLVRPTRIDDTFPFLEPVVIRFERKDEKTLFHETWAMNETELGVFFDLSKSCWYRNLSYTDSQISENDPNRSIISLRDRIHVSILSEVAMEIDTERDPRHLFGLNQPDLERLVENFLCDPLADRLIDRIWSDFQSTIVHVDDYAQVPLYNLFSKQLLFDIDLLDVVTPYRNSSANFYFDSLYVDNRNDNSSRNNMTSTILIHFPGFRYEILNEPGRTTRTTVSIKNAGVYNQMPPCTDKHTNRDKCLEEFLVSTKAEICDCIPFTERRFVIGSASNGRIQKLFCTPTIYKNCLHRAKKEAEKETSKRSFCSPCVGVRNIYLASTISLDESQCTRKSNSNDCYRARVTFECTESFYAVFQERKQLGLSQLISQVGGDLGLYIGFSMIGLWQFILSMCSTCTSRRRGTANESDDISWIRFILGFFVNNKDHNIDGHEMKETKSPADERIVRLEDAVGKINSDLTQLNKEMTDMKNILQRLDQRF